MHIHREWPRSEFEPLQTLDLNDFTDSITNRCLITGKCVWYKHKGLRMKLEENLRAVLSADNTQDHCGHVAVTAIPLVWVVETVRYKMLISLIYRHIAEITDLIASLLTPMFLCSNFFLKSNFTAFKCSFCFFYSDCLSLAKTQCALGPSNCKTNCKQESITKETLHH